MFNDMQNFVQLKAKSTGLFNVFGLHESLIFFSSITPDLCCIVFPGKISTQQKTKKKGKQYFEPFYADALKVFSLFFYSAFNIIERIPLADGRGLRKASGRLSNLRR